MKRKLLIFLTALMLSCALSFTLTACGNPTPPTGEEKQDITGITFVGATYTYDGTEKSLTITGDLPNGVAVNYTNNTATNAGTYTAVASLTGEGYNPLTLTTQLVINKATYDMSRVSWDYSSAFTFDGTQKSVMLSGLPNGVTINNYVDNQKTNAGDYIASASFDYDTQNYNEPTIANCNWKINKATITGISTQDFQSFVYDGEFHLPEILGDIPSNVSTTFLMDGSLTTIGVKEIGEYAFDIVLNGNNYNQLTLSCTVKIKANLTGLVSSVFQAFGQVPNAWSFLPNSFNSANRLISSIPDYSSFVNVSAIPTNGIGKQLNVAYGLLNKMTKAISYVQPVFSAMNTIKNLYTTFIDKNPDDYQSFSGTALGIDFTLDVNESAYSLSASVASTSVKLFANTEENYYGARVQLTETTVLKYQVGENNLIIAMEILDTIATQIEFVRNSKQHQVLGYMYEFITLDDKQLRAASTLIEIGETYTTLIGTKGDFIPTADSRNCEIYLNSTGELVGTEVREKLNIKGLGDAIYNTLWYTINDVSGITNIKKVDEKNGLNADTIYINNATKAIHSKEVNVWATLTNPKALSRRFDIEFKTMYFYTYDAQKEEYTEVSCEIPMIFVQEENFDTFIEDFSNENEEYLTDNIALNVSSADKNAVNYGYYTLLNVYDVIKETISFDTVINFCKQ